MGSLIGRQMFCADLATWLTQSSRQDTEIPWERSAKHMEFNVIDLLDKMGLYMEYVSNIYTSYNLLTILQSASCRNHCQ